MAAPRRHPQTCVFVSKCLHIPHCHALLPPFSFRPPVPWAASPTTWLSTFKDSRHVSWLTGDPGCLESAEESAHPHCLWTCFAVRLSSLRASYVGLASRVGSLSPPHVEWMTVQSLAGLARLAGVAVVAVAGTGVEVLLGEIAALDFSLVAEETLGVILHKRRQCTSLFMCLFS